MNKLIVLLSLFLAQGFYAQIKENSYQLGALDNLLTPGVKKIVDQNIRNKPTVFLGEAVHYSGSDFLAKTEFVKYLVTQHGYKNIAFESDFFGLFFDHNKHNLFRFWSVSEQCKPLFDFLKENNVTIWGFDNQMHSHYSKREFVPKLSEFLSSHPIQIDQKFMSLSEALLKNGYDSRKLLSKTDVEYLKQEVQKLLDNEKVHKDQLWMQILESYKTTIDIYTVKDDSSDKNVIAIRDKQMAKNLDFLVKRNDDQKFIVWLANGHMSKRDDGYMNGQTMGAQFIEMNPDSSYHIAFGSIRMPPEKSEKSIVNDAKNSNSILSYLPSVNNNYFLDASNITNGFPLFKSKTFIDGRIFNLRQKKAELLSHFDALVFIAKGIEVSYGK